MASSESQLPEDVQFVFLGDLVILGMRGETNNAQTICFTKGKMRMSQVTGSNLNKVGNSPKRPISCFTMKQCVMTYYMALETPSKNEVPLYQAPCKQISKDRNYPTELVV